MAGTARWRGESNVEMDFFLNNQADALIIRNYSVINLYMFGASSLPIFRNSPRYLSVIDRPLIRLWSHKIMIL